MASASLQAPTTPLFQKVEYTDWKWTSTIWEAPFPLSSGVSSEQLRSPTYWLQTAAKWALIPFVIVVAFEALTNVSIAFHNYISVPLANKVVTWLRSQDAAIPSANAVIAAPQAPSEEPSADTPIELSETEADDEDDIGLQASIAEPRLSENEATELQAYLEGEESGEDLGKSSGSGSLIHSPRNQSEEEEEQKTITHARDLSLGDYLPQEELSGEEARLGVAVNQSLDEMRKSKYFPNPAEQPSSSWSVWPFGKRT